MSHRRGMSQTLALIVAASVLMMTALTVIFMVQGGLDEVGQGTNTCGQTIEAKCGQVSDSSNIRVPDSCTDESGNKVPAAPRYLPDTPGNQIECRIVN